MKILVGNKVDKVRFYPLSSLRSQLYLSLTYFRPPHPLQEFSRQVPASEARAFAERMNSLFIETSAKTCVGVSETFTEVVEKIIATPELWDASGKANGGSPGGQGTDGGRGGMPGGVQVVGLGDGHGQGQQAAGGCAC